MRSILSHDHPATPRPPDRAPTPATTCPWTAWCGKDWREAVADDKGKVERIPYELCVLVALRDAVRRREIYVEGAARRRNPEDDLPSAEHR